MDTSIINEQLELHRDIIVRGCWAETKANCRHRSLISRY